eukprot:gnl/TRDRNA2_/TRDRNA2_78543_c0_seq1.p1 gnl/TRDRNA2_/TRDRNA2_78543_c0~~gnl/TRDRNA2_/TRDRNA2_78543_c0_seq1.p1  ORF type:complete len:381 (+),score=68.18 gnl/TRDRNA2_/TRDRNA2_78543_c0_seq1:104-1246(+)
MERPSECQEVIDNNELWDLSPQKLTRPQKRRRRLQLAAAGRAAETAGDTHASREAQQRGKCSNVDTDTFSTMNAKLDVLGVMMRQVMDVLGITQLDASDSSCCAVTPSWISCLGDLAGAVDRQSNGLPSSCLREDAPVFTPNAIPGVLAEHLAKQCQAARCIQRAWKAYASSRKLDKSHEPVISAALPGVGDNGDRSSPHRVFCSRCWKLQDKCGCTVPMLKTTSSCCTSCGELAATCACGLEQHLEERAETNSAGTWDECEVCGCISAQDDILECDGRGCSTRAHTFCMTKVEAPDSEEAWMCPQCIAADNSLTGSSRDSEEDDVEDGEPCTAASASHRNLTAVPYDELMTLLNDERERRMQEEQIAHTAAQELLKPGS